MEISIVKHSRKHMVVERAKLNVSHGVAARLKSYLGAVKPTAEVKGFQIVASMHIYTHALFINILPAAPVPQLNSAVLAAADEVMFIYRMPGNPIYCSAVVT
jgi:hypothetical protein